jgi:hypothetical protein
MGNGNHHGDDVILLDERVSRFSRANTTGYCATDKFLNKDENDGITT